jgi:hypothetical protein
MGFLFGLKLWFLFSIDLHHLHNNSSVNSCMKNNLLANHHLFRCDVVLGVIIFGLIRFLSKKIIKIKF